eukprot:11225629-Lingulodinium_polyedra.AAC.1
MAVAHRVQYARHWEAAPHARSGAGSSCFALEISIEPGRRRTIDEPAITALGIRDGRPEFQ